MLDLTRGPIGGHLVRLAVPIAVGMAFQMLYHLVDLYFVAKLGQAAIAGVSAAGSVQFLTMAMTQVLGIGMMALIAHAVGRKHTEQANRVYHQGLLLAAGATVGALILALVAARPFMTVLAEDAATVDAGTTYLRWFAPALALQFPLFAMASALRGCGLTRPTMIAQSLSVLLNALLAPILITGWLTGHALGVAGAGLASSVAVLFGVALMAWFVRRTGGPLELRRDSLRPHGATIRQIVRIGLPPGGEFALLFAYIAVIYVVIAPFGAEAQAGFGIGNRMMQVLFLPAMALSFAAAPVAGQNMGAGLDQRVRETFRVAVLLCSAFMVSLTLFCQFFSADLIGVFTADPAVIAYGAGFLHIVSWNFIGAGIAFTASALFQALGNTVPAVLATATRIPTFMVPAFVLAALPGFTVRQLWILSVASMLGQAAVSLWLLHREFGRRLIPTPAAA